MLNGNLDKILDFIQEHLKYKDREILSKYLKEHDRYGTLDYAVDDKGNILGFVRWNMSSDSSIGYILDLAVSKEWRNKGIGRDFILRALRKFPEAKKLSFQRGIRGDNRSKVLNIKGIIGKRIL